ncbi:MAG TPA: RNA-binding protein [Caulobacteraceae bacterium]|nr:RNA-binding protein [Caulobacteraceae bacterium]
MRSEDRERRDIVSGEVMPEERLVRFVAGPDGSVVPDLARKLPGRGLWVEAKREAVQTAAKRGAFSRAAKTKLTAAPDLADRVEQLLRTRLIAGLGLARRAGDLILGFEKVAAAVSAGKAAWLIEAADGADDGRRKMLQVVRRAQGAGLSAPRLIALFGSEELGLALGLGNVIHLAFLAGRGAERWTLDVERLSGFCPLLPQSWREEP